MLNLHLPADGVPAVKSDLRSNWAAIAKALPINAADFGAVSDAVEAPDWGSFTTPGTDNYQAFADALVAARAHPTRTLYIPASPDGMDGVEALLAFGFRSSVLRNRISTTENR